jgi:hypothetical protein
MLISSKHLKACLHKCISSRVTSATKTPIFVVGHICNMTQNHCSCEQTLRPVYTKHDFCAALCCKALTLPKDLRQRGDFRRSTKEVLHNTMQHYRILTLVYMKIMFPGNGSFTSSKLRTNFLTAMRWPFLTSPLAPRGEIWPPRGEHSLRFRRMEV